MIVKNILSEELMTLAEVKEALEGIRLKRADEPEELGYELRRAIKHAEIFSEGAAAESRNMTEVLSGLEKMTPEIAIKISDIRPQTRTRSGLSTQRSGSPSPTRISTPSSTWF